MNHCCIACNPTGVLPQGMPFESNFEPYKIKIISLVNYHGCYVTIQARYNVPVSTYTYIIIDILKLFVITLITLKWRRGLTVHRTTGQ